MAHPYGRMELGLSQTISIWESFGFSLDSVLIDGSSTGDVCASRSRADCPGYRSEPQRRQKHFGLTLLLAMEKELGSYLVTYSGLCRCRSPSYRRFADSTSAFCRILSELWLRYARPAHQEKAGRLVPPGLILVANARTWSTLPAAGPPQFDSVN